MYIYIYMHTFCASLIVIYAVHTVLHLILYIVCSPESNRRLYGDSITC